jgi:hypothetical protein
MIMKRETMEAQQILFECESELDAQERADLNLMRCLRKFKEDNDVLIVCDCKNLNTNKEDKNGK